MRRSFLFSGYLGKKGLDVHQVKCVCARALPPYCRDLKNNFGWNQNVWVYFLREYLITQVCVAISLCKLIKRTFVFGGGLHTDSLIFNKICIFSIA